MGGEFKKVFVVEFALFVLFTDFSPINIPAVHQKFALYLIDVRLRSMRTARLSLFRPSSVVQQFWMHLWSIAEQTITSSMCESATPVLVGRLLVQVLWPGLFDLGSKNVFMMHRRCAR
jgi:hypothetical protein